MKISVVTVCLNAAGTIAGTIESFLEQDHPDKDLLVVDGASRDATLAIVERYADRGVALICEPDEGIYDAMNKGLASFTGDAVGFLNADDRYTDRHALSAIDAALHQADIVHGNLDFVRDHQDRQVVRRWRGSPFRPGAFGRGWMPAHPTFYIRREVARAVGEFDRRYRIAGDYDYMLRAMELHDFRHAFVDRTLVDMMQGGTSNSGLRAYVRSNLEALRSRRRWLAAGPVDRALFAKPLGKVGQFVVHGRRDGA